MNKLFYGAAVLALAIGVSGPSMAQDSGLATGQTDGVTSGRASMGTQAPGVAPDATGATTGQPMRGTQAPVMTPDSNLETGQTDGVTSGRAALGRGGVGPGDPTYPTGTTNLQVPASCTSTDVAAVRSDAKTISNDLIRERLEVQLQTAENQFRDGNPARCAQILADARNSIVKAGGTVNDISAAAGGGVVPPAGAGPAGSEGVAGGGPAEGMAPGPALSRSAIRQYAVLRFRDTGSRPPVGRLLFCARMRHPHG